MITITTATDYGRSSACAAWLRGLGLIASNVYRVDIEVLTLTLTIYEWDRTEAGLRFSDLPGGPPRTRTPYTLQLASVAELPDLADVLAAEQHEAAIRERVNAERRAEGDAAWKERQAETQEVIWDSPPKPPVVLFCAHIPSTTSDADASSS